MLLKQNLIVVSEDGVLAAIKQRRASEVVWKPGMRGTSRNDEGDYNFFSGTIAVPGNISVGYSFGVVISSSFVEASNKLSLNTVTLPHAL